MLPETPHLSLQIHAAIELPLTLPYPIRFTIRRLAKGNATDDRSCIFHWNPTTDAFSSSGLVLLRHPDSRGAELDRVEVDHGNENLPGSAKDEKFPWELRPGEEITLSTLLPEKYHRAIRGQDYWVACEAENGFEKASEEHMRLTEEESKRGLQGKGVGWLAEEVEVIRRVSGSPYFTVAVEGQRAVKGYEKIAVTLRFTYHGVTGTEGNLQASEDSDTARTQSTTDLTWRYKALMG
ncbi:hypothetical protein N0V88_006361 [Collariella sp. IMI 366227]|nr:hypothetical protein N0V88_006361 [Collariella sp. IMI 366227]